MRSPVCLALAVSFLAAPALADPPRRLTAASPVAKPAKLPPVRALPPGPVVPRPSGSQPWTGSTVRFGDGYRVTDPIGRRLEGNGRGWELAPNGSEWRGTGGNFGRSCPAAPPGGSSFCP
jgi:hypothetical protein